MRMADRKPDDGDRTALCRTINELRADRNRLAAELGESQAELRTQIVIASELRAAIDCALQALVMFPATVEQRVGAHADIPPDYGSAIGAEIRELRIRERDAKLAAAEPHACTREPCEVCDEGTGAGEQETTDWVVPPEPYARVLRERNELRTALAAAKARHYGELQRAAEQTRAAAEGERDLVLHRVRTERDEAALVCEKRETELAAERERHGRISDEMCDLRVQLQTAEARAEKAEGERDKFKAHLDNAFKTSDRLADRAETAEAERDAWREAARELRAVDKLGLTDTNVQNYGHGRGRLEAARAAVDKIMGESLCSKCFKASGWYWTYDSAVLGGCAIPCPKCNADAKKPLPEEFK